MNKNFTFPIRIYYEDTDAGGIVYHANYLKFAERARTEALRSLGLSQSYFLREYKTSLIVYACELNYLAPSYLDDILEVMTCFKKAGHVRLELSQLIMREDQKIATLDVVLACVNSEGKPVRLLSDLRRLLTDFGENNNG